MFRILCSLVLGLAASGCANETDIPMGCSVSGVRWEMPMLGSLDLARIVPADGFDYVVRHPGTDGYPSYGSPCASASDGGCLARLEEAASSIPMGDGFASTCTFPGFCPAYLLATRGDEVLTIDNLAGVRELLGTIDTPEEAVLLVHAMSSPSGGEYYSVPRVGVTPTGFDVLTEYYESYCVPAIRRSHTLHVDLDGSTSSVCDVVIQNDDICI